MVKSVPNFTVCVDSVPWPAEATRILRRETSTAIRTR